MEAENREEGQRLLVERFRKLKKRTMVLPLEKQNKEQKYNHRNFADMRQGRCFSSVFLEAINCDLLLIFCRSRC